MTPGKGKFKNTFRSFWNYLEKVLSLRCFDFFWILLHNLSLLPPFASSFSTQEYIHKLLPHINQDFNGHVCFKIFKKLSELLSYKFFPNLSFVQKILFHMIIIPLFCNYGILSIPKNDFWTLAILFDISAELQFMTITEIWN